MAFIGRLVLEVIADAQVELILNRTRDQRSFFLANTRASGYPSVHYGKTINEISDHGISG